MYHRIPGSDPSRNGNNAKRMQKIRKRKTKIHKQESWRKKTREEDFLFVKPSLFRTDNGRARDGQQTGRRTDGGSGAWHRYKSKPLWLDASKKAIKIHISHLTVLSVTQSVLKTRNTHQIQRVRNNEQQVDIHRRDRGTSRHGARRDSRFMRY